MKKQILKKLDQIDRMIYEGAPQEEVDKEWDEVNALRRVQIINS